MSIQWTVVPADSSPTSRLRRRDGRLRHDGRRCAVCSVETPQGDTREPRRHGQDRHDGAGRHRRDGEPRRRRQRLVPKSAPGRVLGHRRDVRPRRLHLGHVRRSGQPVRDRRRHVPDKAGNVSQASAFGLRYDATPPTITRVDRRSRRRGRPRRLGGRRRRRRSSCGGRRASTARRRASSTATPTASSSTARSATAAATTTGCSPRRGRQPRHAHLLGHAGPCGCCPRPTASASTARPCCAGPTCAAPATTTSSSSANGRKLLSAWPGKARLELERAWRFDGHRFRLKPGRRYTWLVWPGRGKRSRNDYGPLIGRGTFTVAAS